METGKKYNRLTAIRFIRKNKYYTQYWKFKCDCGASIVSQLPSVKNGYTKSCGCLVHEKNSKHNMTGTPLYHTWEGIKARCLNEDSHSYKDYGGRGITICDKWKNDFYSFYLDMHKSYKSGLSIDRIDNNSGYWKENCRWVDKEVQANNRRNSKFLIFNGVSKTLNQWARFIGVNKSTLYSRIHLCHWTVEKALTTKITK